MLTMNESVFRNERVFFHSNTLAEEKSGWYFEMRGGKAQGPFKSREEAQAVMESLIKIYKQRDDQGGRESEPK